MKEKGILFKPPLVLGLLSAAYTQGLIGYRKCFENICPKIETRRIIKPQPIKEESNYGAYHIPGKGPLWDYPLYKKGQILWVREPWYAGTHDDHLKPSEMNPEKWLMRNGGLWYQAGDTKPKTPICSKGRYRNARFMPRWASRIDIEVIKDTRAERLLDISERSARNEGFPGLKDQESAKKWFMLLWEQIHGSRYVYQNPNPMLWVIEFKIKSVHESICHP